MSITGILLNQAKAKRPLPILISLLARGDGRQVLKNAYFSHAKARLPAFCGEGYVALSEHKGCTEGHPSSLHTLSVLRGGVGEFPQTRKDNTCTILPK